VKRRKAFAKEEKLQIIMGAFLEEYRNGQKWLTAADIARAIDNAPSTKLRALLTNLVKQGAIVFEVEDSASIMGFRRLYGLSPEYLLYAAAPVSQQKKGRDIRINTRKGTFIEVLR